jgi:polyribonucleotide 5'-hydroxyl-kinase
VNNNLKVKFLILNSSFDEKERVGECECQLLVNAAGLIVNTCGWVEGIGYELLLHSIDVFMIDVILVIDHERLYSDLTLDIKTKLKSQRNIEIIKLPKSGGVRISSSHFRSSSE